MPITTRVPSTGGPFHAPTPQTTLLSPPWQHNSFLISKEASLDSSYKYCPRLEEERVLSLTKKMNFGTHASLQEAALLLQEVASIASNELKGDGGFKLQTQEIRRPPGMVELASSDVSDSSESRYVEDNRFRTIRPSSSQSSSTPPGVLMPAPLGGPPMLPPFTLATHIVHTVSPTPRSVLPLPSSSQPPIILPLVKPPALHVPPVLSHCNHEAPAPPVSSTIPAKKSKYVGTSSSHAVKGILKKKFSWKNYPDLEGFLIGKREEYLNHSSAHNYTVTQKDFNNKLTTELLELASSLGYIFDRFSFVQVRDRIRCYYKSYLQSLKKQQKL